MELSNNIILIGFMASGKSAIGRRVALKSDKFFIDLDNAIESSVNKKIGKIFKEDGEKSFRKLESFFLKWFKKNISNTLLSTGGGTAYFNKDLKKLGTVFFIDTPFELIYERLNNLQESTKRPLCTSKKDLKSLYNKRYSKYKKNAHFIIDGSRELEVIVKDIQKIIHSKKKI